ncbi:hypothetical protein ABK040_014697 [Willaertia magna]
MRIHTSFLLFELFVLLLITHTALTDTGYHFPSARLFPKDVFKHKKFMNNPADNEKRFEIHSHDPSQDFPFHKIPFLTPVYHPFDTRQEFEETLRNDPFGLENNHHYETSEKLMKRALKTKRTTLATFKANTHYSPLQVRKHVMEQGSFSSLNANAKVLAGVVSLDSEERVWDVICHGQTQVDVVFADGDGTAKKWVPGTKFVIGKQWLCFEQNEVNVTTEINQEAVFRLVKKRQIIARAGSMLKVRFTTEEIKVNDLFVSCQLSYNSLPTPVAASQSELFHHNEIKKYKEAGNNTSTDFNRKRSSQVYSNTKEISLLKFNYNEATQQAEQKDLILKQVNDNISIHCLDCFIRVRAGIKIEIDMGWTSFNYFQFLIGGGWEAQATLKTIADYSYQSTGDTVLVQSPPVPILMFIWGIPIYMQFGLKLRGYHALDANINIEMVQQVSSYYDRYIGGKYVFGSGFQYVETPSISKFDVGSPKISMEGNAGLQVAIYPSIDISFNYLVDGEVYVKPLLDFQLVSSGFYDLGLTQGNLFVNLDTHYKSIFGYKFGKSENEFEIHNPIRIDALSGEFALVSKKYITNGDESSNSLPTLSKTITNVFSLKLTVTVSIEEISWYYSDNWYLSYKSPSNTERKTEKQQCTLSTCQFTFVLNGVKYANEPLDMNLMNAGVIFDETYKSYSFPMNRFSAESKGTWTAKDLTVAYEPYYPTYVFYQTPKQLFELGHNNCHEFEFKAASFLTHKYISFSSDDALFAYSFNVTKTGSAFHYTYNAPHSGIFYFDICNYVGGTIKYQFTQTLSFMYLNTNTKFENGTHTIQPNVPITFLSKLDFSQPKVFLNSKLTGDYYAMFYQAKIDSQLVYSKGIKYNSKEATPPANYWVFDVDTSDKTTVYYYVATFISQNSLTFNSFENRPVSNFNFEFGPMSQVQNGLMKEWHVEISQIHSPYLELKTGASPISVNLNQDIYQAIVGKDSSNLIVQIQPNQVSHYAIPTAYYQKSIAFSASSPLNSFEIISNFKLVSGKSSAAVKLAPTEEAHFALACTSVSPLNMYLRIIDYHTNVNILEENQITVTNLFRFNSAAIDTSKQLNLIKKSSGFYFIDSTQSSKCNTPNQYVQFTMRNNGLKEITIIVEISVINTVSNAIMNIIEPDGKGQVLFDISSLKSQYQASAKQGVVFTAVPSTTGCNLDLIINNDNNEPPSFSKSSTIFKTGMRTSPTTTVLSVSFLTSSGTILLAYAPEICEFTLTHEPLEMSYIDLKFKISSSVNNNLDDYVESFKAENRSSIESITLKINSPYHSWTNDYLNPFTNNPSRILQDFSISINNQNYVLDAILNCSSISVVDSQTIEISSFSDVKQSESIWKLIELHGVTISFVSNSLMFDSNFDIKPRNHLKLTNSIIPISSGDKPQPNASPYISPSTSVKPIISNVPRESAKSPQNSTVPKDSKDLHPRKESNATKVVSHSLIVVVLCLIVMIL